MTVLANCGSCGKRDWVQSVPVGEDNEWRCRFCAGDRWRRVYVEPTLLSVLERVEECLDEHAGVIGRDALILLADLRAAREAL